MADAPALFKEAIDTLSRHALDRQRVNWQSIAAKHGSGLKAGDPPRMAHDAIVSAIKAIGDSHTRYVPAPSEVPNQVPATSNASAATAPSHPPIPVLPIGEMLDPDIAYLVIPGCMAQDVNGLREFASALDAQVKSLASKSPRGWIIDLRLNGGGNIWPMLLGLRPILGDGPTMTSIASESVSTFGVSAQSAWIDWGNGPEPQLTWGDGFVADAEPLPHVPVAVMLGPWTMSSGEALAISLRGRADMRSFGESTAGLTTVTNRYSLSDGSVLIIAVSAMGDRLGKPMRGAIVPDQPVPFAGWPSANDEPATAARRWLRSQFQAK